MRQPPNLARDITNPSTEILHDETDRAAARARNWRLLLLNTRNEAQDGNLRAMSGSTRFGVERPAALVEELGIEHAPRAWCHRFITGRRNSSLLTLTLRIGMRRRVGRQPEAASGVGTSDGGAARPPAIVTRECTSWRDDVRCPVH